MFLSFCRGEKNKGNGDTVSRKLRAERKELLLAFMLRKTFKEGGLGRGLVQCSKEAEGWLNEGAGRGAFPPREHQDPHQDRKLELSEKSCWLGGGLPGVVGGAQEGGPEAGGHASVLGVGGILTAASQVGSYPGYFGSSCLPVASSCLSKNFTLFVLRA